MRKLVTYFFCGFVLWTWNDTRDKWVSMDWFETREACQTARSKAIENLTADFVRKMSNEPWYIPKNPSKYFRYLTACIPEKDARHE